MNKITPALIYLLLCHSVAPAQTSEHTPMPSDAEIQKILNDRINVMHQGVGIVVGIIDADGHRRIVSAGTMDTNNGRKVDAGTIFEIGSVTKVFTSLLLADMVQRGEVALTDPVSKYLPPGAKVPERGGRSITLQDLSTQTSGLPRLPTNFVPKNPANPYADYSPERLYDFLSTYQLTRDIGSQYEYSNLGVGLLGHALARRAGMNYESLVKSRICSVLGMPNTGATLTASMKDHFAIGHNATLAPAAYWDLDALAGASALRSNAQDMLTFVAANLGLPKTPLYPAMQSMIAVRKPTGNPGLEIGLGWHIFTGPDEIVWHNGGTGGFRSFIGYTPKSHIGVVVLSNTYTDSGIDDIGLHLLDPKRPTLTLRTEIKVDPKLFGQYVGRYQINPNFLLDITRDGDHIYAKATGQPRFEIFAKSERTFFPKSFDAELTFEVDEKGQTTGLTLHQGGANTPAKRISADVPPPPEHKQVKVDSKILDTYAGEYELDPNFTLTITREGDHLSVQATGQPKFEAFPESENKFFLQAVEAQLTFQTSPEGKVTYVVLHQNGADVSGKRK